MCQKRTCPAQSRGLDAAPNERAPLNSRAFRPPDDAVLPRGRDAGRCRAISRHIQIHATSTAFPARLRILPDDEFAAFLLPSPEMPLDKLGSGNRALRAEAAHSGWQRWHAFVLVDQVSVGFGPPPDHDRKEQQNASRRPPARRSVLDLGRPRTGRAPIRAVAATRKLPAISAAVSGGDTKSSSRCRPGCSRRCRNRRHRRKCRQRRRHWGHGWWRGCGRAPRFSPLRWRMLLTPARTTVAPRRNPERTLP